ncbi:MAG: hypothetical protein HKN11_12050 [Rhizobiales bacterium]|nr:hypothetical protein [Hyphomicrobiales bacterium]
MNIQNRPVVWSATHKLWLAMVLAAQLTAAYVIGSGHWLANDAHSLLPPIGITAVVPVVIFVLAYNVLPAFRSFVLALDIRLLTAVQLWRVVGLAFLLLYALEILPASFAWPAGIGDVAVGISAIYVLSRMNNDPAYVTGNGYAAFHAMGLLDFAVAIGTAGLAAGGFPGLTSNGPTTAAMDVWPLNIFPSFIVPVFIILQLTALLKARQMRRAIAGKAQSASQPA